LLDFLVICALVLVFFGIVPAIGALLKRYKWHKLRRRFDELRLRPVLNYHSYWQEASSLEDVPSKEGGDLFRFIGGFESITDGQTLWIRSDNLTVPVSLENTESYVLPDQKSGRSDDDDLVENPPEKFKLGNVSEIIEGARVFAGGSLKYINGRRCFVSSKQNPLIVFIYNGPDHSVPTRIMRSARQRNDYWNSFTPYSLITGVFGLIMMAVAYYARPAFRLTVTVSFMAMFVPLYPFIPPGLLFTLLFQRLTWKAKILRSYSDLARLPLRFLAGRGGKEKSSLLPSGEKYGVLRCSDLPPEAKSGGIPFLLPEYEKDRTGWFIFGKKDGGQNLPIKAEDPFATFGILPGDPAVLTKKFAKKAYLLEAAAWVFLLAGIALNVFFIGMILTLLGFVF